VAGVSWCMPERTRQPSPSKMLHNGCGFRHPVEMNPLVRGDARALLGMESCRKRKSGTALEKRNGKR
jgi:hypothetical protein